MRRCLQRIDKQFRDQYPKLPNRRGLDDQPSWLMAESPVIVRGGLVTSRISPSGLSCPGNKGSVAKAWYFRLKGILY